jgi:hypothetical protein
MCFVFIWEQTATCATYGKNWLVFITDEKSIYIAVWTGALNTAVCASSLKDSYCCKYRYNVHVTIADATSFRHLFILMLFYRWLEIKKVSCLTIQTCCKDLRDCFIVLECNYVSTDNTAANHPTQHVTFIGERRGVYRGLVGKPEGRDLLKDPGVGGRIILKWIFRKWDGEHELDWYCSEHGQVADFFLTR